MLFSGCETTPQKVLMDRNLTLVALHHNFGLGVHIYSAVAVFFGFTQMYIELLR